MAGLRLRQAKTFLLACLLCCLAASLAAQVVINEVCYDPVDDDTGYEWIELYNAGDADVDLEGALLMSGGAVFQIVFEIPHYILRAGRFLLIGESLIPQAVFHTDLAFQNGGALTDGIRYVSPDGSYTDTVLYDEPNGGLPDDSGTEGTSFAPDVPAGWSLARIKDGWDTNACGSDWLAEQNCTPGLPNHVYADYALLHPEVWQDGDWRFGIWIKNLSAISPDQAASLRVLLDGVEVGSSLVCGLSAGDSLQFIQVLPVQDEANHLVQAVLGLTGDVDPANNSVSVNLYQQDLANPVINELMYDPGPGKQEWIELYVGFSTRRGDFTLRDAGGNEFSFSLPASAGYYVLCSSAQELLSAYPDCPLSAAIEVSGWATLNNDGDSLYLLDADGAILDQMSYTGLASWEGVSLERFLNQAQEPGWRYSLDPSGATPGRANSQSISPPEFEGSLKLVGSPCNPRAGGSISIFYSLEQTQSRVSCGIYDRVGHRVRVLADDLAIPATGSLVWDGKDSSGRYVPRGLYFILWESRPSGGGKILRRQFSAALYD